MRVFGNLSNRIQESPSSITPEVGMGCTILMYSDRHAATIVEVKSPRLIVIQRDTATRKDKNGMSESQEWEFTPNPSAEREEVSLRKNGRWMLANGRMSNGTVVRIGERDEYYDFGF